MKHTLLIGLIICFLVGLSNGQQAPQPIKIDLITKIPSEIDGCSGLYTYDTTSMKRNKYVIVTDLQEFGLIKIQGKEIRLKISDKKELSSTTFKTVFKGDGYIITLVTKTGKRIDELSIETGTLEITKDAQKVILKIHGESGC